MRYFNRGLACTGGSVLVEIEGLVPTNGPARVGVLEAARVLTTQTTPAPVWSRLAAALVETQSPRGTEVIPG